MADRLDKWAEGLVDENEELRREIRGLVDQFRAENERLHKALIDELGFLDPNPDEGAAQE